MEGTILSMLDAPDLLADGVQGLRNLDTLSAHRALAKFVKETPPTEVVGPYQTALRYLGEIGGSQRFSVGKMSRFVRPTMARAFSSHWRRSDQFEGCRSGADAFQ